MDSISDLPNDLICIIVSSLSSKSAALTKVLSKRWLNVFTVEPDLVFDNSNNNEEKSFQGFVEGLLKRDASCRIRRFSLKLRNLDSSQFKLVNKCLCNVLKRGVMDLNINVQEDGYLLPSEVFTCKTVEKLKLGSEFVIDMIPKNALLPSLKTLILVTVRFDDLGGDCAFQKLLSSCPVITELVVTGCNWARSVSSLTLERLTLRRGDSECYLSDSETMSFDTPNLTFLDYSDVLCEDYPVVNLRSLVEAKLDFNSMFLGESKLEKLIQGLRNAQSLCVSTFYAMKVLFNNFRAQVPVFENLTRVTVTTEGRNDCWYGLIALNKKSPNLKTLIIEGGVHHYYDDQDHDQQGNPEYVCKCLDDYCFLLNIQTLKITEFKGNSGEMGQMRHILMKSPNLEDLEITIQVDGEDLDDEDDAMIWRDVLDLPKASSKLCCRFIR